MLQILDRLYEGVYCTDKTRKITFWNTAAEQITGFLSEEVIGTGCHDGILCHVSEDGAPMCNSVCPMQATLNDAEQRETIIYLHHKLGHRIAVNVRVIPVFGGDGKLLGGAEIFRPVNDEREQFKRIQMLEKMAFLDPLTGLPNRRYVSSKIDARLNELKQYAWPFGILFIDIDNFKLVNDTYGHDVGDAVLKMIGRALKDSNRAHDVVGRFGGEEFIALISNVDKAGLLKTAERLRVLVESSSLRRDTAFSVTVSIGAAIADPNDTEKSLLKRADTNLYLSKKQGRNLVTG